MAAVKMESSPLKLTVRPFLNIEGRRDLGGLAVGLVILFFGIAIND